MVKYENSKDETVSVSITSRFLYVIGQLCCSGYIMQNELVYITTMNDYISILINFKYGHSFFFLFNMIN